MSFDIQTHTYAPSISMSGLTYYRNQDGVNIYKFDNLKRDALDLWMKISQHNERVAASHGEATLLIIFDVRGAGAPTAYALAQGLRSANEAPDELYRISTVITEDRLTSRIVNFFLHKLPRKVAEALKVSANDEEAMRWLFQNHEDYLGTVTK